MKCSIMPAAVVALSLSLTIRAAPSPAATAQPEAGSSQGVVDSRPRVAPVFLCASPRNCEGL
jgi:hypothetical protein